MKIPKKVKIGGFIITIKAVKDIILTKGELGNYEPKEQNINIDESSTVQQQEEVFIHEILEAIKSIYDIELKHNLLTLIATVLHQVIKDNPEIFKEESDA